MATLRFGVIGTGRMAARMTRNLIREPGISVSAIASANPERARAFARSFDVGAYGTSDQLLARDDVDAVYIASRNADHARLSLAALTAGKAVLCEKPAAISPAEAAMLAAGAQASGTLFMEAISTPFLPAFARAAALARSEALGEPTHLCADFSHPAPTAVYPSLYQAAGGGVLLDRLVYPLVLALAVFGPVRRVRSSILTQPCGLDVEASVLLEHCNAGRSQIGVSLLSQGSNAATIGCRNGSISLSASLTNPERVTLTRTRAGGAAPVEGWKSGAREWLKGIAAVRRLARRRAQKVEDHSFGTDHFAFELRHFAELLREGRTESPVVPLQTTIDVQAIIAAARLDAAGCHP